MGSLRGKEELEVELCECFGENGGKGNGPNRLIVTPMLCAKNQTPLKLLGVFYLGAGVRKTKVRKAKRVPTEED